MKPSTRISIVAPSAGLCSKDDDPCGSTLSIALSQDAVDNEVSSGNSKITQHQLIKQVNKWFQSWKTWQQKTLLCGITNRCSTQQLEALATTLEPVFHRDFVTTVRRKYPSTGFKPEALQLRADRCLHQSLHSDAPPPQQQSVSFALSQHHNAWASHLAPLGGSLPPSRGLSGAALSLDSSLGLPQGHHHQGGSMASMRKPSFVEFIRMNSFRVSAAKKSVASSKRKHRRILPRCALPPDDPISQRHRSSLALQYRQQLVQIWQWISDWKEHEAMVLMVEVVKLCPPEIQNYLAQCLYQRLRERIDINWLPDQVLLHIFSKLSTEDINSAEKVCQRWRHLCSSEDLWKFKCQELGLQFGITDMLSVIRETLPMQETLDWRMAFLELSQMISEAQEGVKRPPELSIKFSPLKSLSESDDGVFENEAFSRLETEKSLLGRPKIASQLARESRRLKRGLLPSKFFRMTMAFEMFDGWPSASPSCYNETPETPVEKRKASLTSLTPMPDERPLTSPVKSVFESVTSSRPPVGGSTGGGCKKRDQENKGETALDMRMNLTQAKDLLGNCLPDLNLQWKTDSVDGDTPLGMRSEDFSSHIQPIQRVRKMQGHMDAVSCIEVDFRRLISGSHDRSIRIWDIRSGRSIHKLYGHKGRISSLKFDEENILFSASWDTTIMVWDLVTFQRKAVLNGHKGSISCLQLTPEFLVSGSHDHTLRVWSRDSLKCVRIIEGHRSHVLCLHCDRVYAFSGSTDQTVRQTVVRTGELMRVFNTFSEPVYRVLVRRYLLITTSESGLISFSNTESGALECIIQAHNRASVNAICLSQGHLYTAGSDHAIKEWDLSSMACVRSLLGHKMAVLDLKVTQRRIVSSSGDNQIRIWETQIPTSSQGDSSLREDTLPLKIIKQENEPKLDRFQ